jgi:hypothetical protein
MPELAISADKICALVDTLREIDGLVTPETDEEIEPGDDSPLALVEDRPDDPRIKEIEELARGLSDDERLDLIALVLVGREDFSFEEWEDARTEARDRLDETGPRLVADLLLGDAAMPDFLETGLQCFGRSCEDWDAEVIAPLPAALAADPQDNSGDAVPTDVGDIADIAQGQEPGLPPSIDLHLVAGAASPSAPEARDTPEGMLGDETMEQKLGQPGHPGEKISRDEVEQAFAAKKPKTAAKKKKKSKGE